MQTSLLTFTDSVGIVAFALSGLFAVKGKKIDPVGVFVVVFVTAFGGGIVRDLVIGTRPMYWIANQEYVWATLALSFFAPVIVRLFQDKLHQTILVWLDAVGLGFFTAGGTSLSLTYDLP